MGTAESLKPAGHHLTQTGGVMLWKLNAAFPSVVWQIYDWYLEPNAGYYFMRNAPANRYTSNGSTWTTARWPSSTGPISPVPV